MATRQITYKSFCWSFGTTSFRTQNFNQKIELQLDLIEQFWQKNSDKVWNSNTQEIYYDFLQENDFVLGDAKNKAKDAREKTSGLVDLGLLTNKRKLTNVGKKLLNLSKIGDFSSDNFLQIPKDSFIYFKQLLKVYDGLFVVRPFIVFLYIIDKFDFLTYDEFKFLLPLCVNKEKTEFIKEQILNFREDKISIDDIILQILLEMENYKLAFELFLNTTTITQNLICKIGMNRKSPKYDLAYFDLYFALKKVFLNADFSEISMQNLLKAISKLKLKIWWKKYLFGSNSNKKIIEKPLEALQKTAFSNIKNESEFKGAFFKIMHLFKAKATLSDYFDLNRRFIKTSDIAIFSDEKVVLDLLPKYYFKSIINEIYNIAFSNSNLLEIDCDLEDISKDLKFNEKKILNLINSDLNLKLTSLNMVNDKAEQERYNRFNKLIDDKFSDEILLELLNLFQNRDDEKINNLVTDNADIPTIFEYILGIIWYKISDKKGKILDFMNLSLEADLLPKTHAGGGEADIIYRYEKTQYYPKHELLIEATLSEKTNQRRMEMEPVSRHLGDRLLATKNLNSYCVFITNFLHINVISDFKARQKNPYYSSDGKDKIDGMNIAPLEIDEIKEILKSKIKYEKLYQIFSASFNSNLEPLDWREVCIKKPIMDIK